MGRWLIGVIVLLFVGLIYGLMTGEARINDMQDNIRADLTAAGHDWASVSMDGNQAMLSGTATNEAERQAAIGVAEAARCSTCKDKHKWHDVIDQIDLSDMAEVVVPVQSPYTFAAIKSDVGNLALSGYVETEEDRTSILDAAREIFGPDTVIGGNIELADGAPNDNWRDVIVLYLRKLARLDNGSLILEDSEGALQGASTAVDVRAALYNEIQSDTPEGYNFIGNVELPDQPAERVGQSGSQMICQSLFDDLRQGRKINFGAGEVAIRGDDSFDLLSDISSAAQLCPSFRITIDGYTSSEGDPEMNQSLSEARANAVLAFLNDTGGIERSRLQARGFGSENPIASNETVEGREQNRRIEFILSRVE